MPAPLVELDRKANRHAALLDAESPFHAAIDELRLDVKRLAAQIVGPHSVVLRLVVVGQNRERVVDDHFAAGFGLLRAASLDQQDRPAEFPLNLFHDGEVIALIAANHRPAGPLPFADPGVEFLDRLDLRGRRRRRLAAGRRRNN